MGVFDWIFNPMVRKFGQKSRDKAIQFSVMRVEKGYDPLEHQQCSSSGNYQKITF